MTVYVFYNLQVSRPLSRIKMEIDALLSKDPLVLGLCEAMGYDLPDRPGYDLVRDRTTRSRANIAAYVRKGKLDSHKWYDLKQTWKRTEHPGTHEPRSWLEMNVDGDQTLVGHQPPQGTNNTIDAQREGIDFLIDRMAPWTRSNWQDRTQQAKDRARERRRLVMADMNRRAGTPGPGPTTLANEIRGSVTGARIDCMVERQFDVNYHNYVTQVGNVILRSDHKHALIVRTEENE